MLPGCSPKRFEEEARERGAELPHQEQKTLPGTPFAPYYPVGDPETNLARLHFHGLRDMHRFLRGVGDGDFPALLHIVRDHAGL